MAVIIAVVYLDVLHVLTGATIGATMNITLCYNQTIRQNIYHFLLVLKKDGEHIRNLVSGVHMQQCI